MKSLVLVTTMLLIAGAQAVPQTGSGSVQGTVRLAGGAPIPNVEIEIVSLELMPRELADFVVTIPPGLQWTPQLVEMGGAIEAATPRRTSSVPPRPDQGGSTTTDAAGRFSFEKLPSGKYWLQARRPGYFGPPSGALPGERGAMAAIDVLPDRTTDIAFSLVRGASVTGRVSGANGRSIPNATVSAFQLRYQDDGRMAFVPKGPRETDDRGEYRLFDLAPGDYRIGVTPPDSTRTSSARAFITDPSLTLPVSLSENAEAPGVNFTVTPQSGFRVSGRVDISLPGASGQSGPPFRVFYLAPLDRNAFAGFSVPTFSNVATDLSKGNFEIVGVPPGSYDLISAPNASGIPLPGRARIEVSSQDLTGVVVTISPGVEVRARLAYPEGKPSGATPELQLQLQEREIVPAPFEASRKLTGSVDPLLDAAGTFVFSSVPQARYTFRFSELRSDAYIADIRENGISVYDDGLIVGSRSPGLIDVMVGLAGETVEGTLQRADHSPVGIQRVVLAPPRPRRHNPALYKSTTTDNSGRFVFPNVPPGEYTLFAWEISPPANAHLNAEFMSPYESLGQSLKVVPGVRVNPIVLAIPTGQTNR